MKRLKKRLNWEDLSKLTNEELYAIHAKIFKCDPILHGRGAFYPQNEAERKIIFCACKRSGKRAPDKKRVLPSCVCGCAFFGE